MMNWYRKVRSYMAQLVSAFRCRKAGKVAGSNPVIAFRQGIKKFMDKPNLTLSIPTMIAIATFVLAPIIGYYSAQASVADTIAQVNTKVEVQTQAQSDEDARLDRIENKVDKLLIHSGINPSSAAISN